MKVERCFNCGNDDYLSIDVEQCETLTKEFSVFRVCCNRCKNKGDFYTSPLSAIRSWNRKNGDEE